MAHNFKEKYSYEKGFAEYYQSKLIPLLYQVEKHRQDALIRFVIIAGACIVGIVIIPIIINIIFDEIEWTYGSCALFIIVTFFLLKYMLDSFKNEAATRVNKLLVAFFGDFDYKSSHDKYDDMLSNLSGTPNDCNKVKKDPQITKSILCNVGFIFPAYDEISYENLIYGNHNNNEIELCRILMEQNLLEGGYKECPIGVFRGLLIVFTLKKNLKGKTFLVQKQNMIMNFFFGSNKHEKVKLKNKAFKKRYDVSSTNLAETNSILSPALQQGIMELAKNFNRKNIQGCIYGNKAVFAIPTKKNHFGSVSLFQSPFNQKSLRNFLKNFNAILQLSDTVSKEITEINHH